MECDRRPPYLSAPAPGFNPRTPCGVRPGALPITDARSRFQSTHSLRSATSTGSWYPLNKEFQSTHSLRSATISVAGCVPDIRVSIHALLAECDHLFAGAGGGILGFNPRTPCGVRPGNMPTTSRAMCFNPRTPCGVRPVSGSDQWSAMKFQSTHSLRSATRGICLLPAGQCVSIHALLAECDNQNMRDPQQASSFNPRTPCGVRLLTRFR